jgi:hypothetical protein
MTYYLNTIQGLLADSFPWSMTMTTESSDSESAVQTTWDAAVLAMWNLAGLQTYLPPTTYLTQTSTSTASATFRQTTKTVSNHNISGGSSDPALPFRTCEIITFRSLFATKWGRGRWFFPGLSYNALAADGYTMLAAAQTELVDALNAFFSGLGGTVQPQILHRKAALDGATTPYSVSPITAADIPDSFASQRRRADKRVPVRSTVTV